MYDHYPRCPTGKLEDSYSRYSASCDARRELRNSSSIIFALLMSVWMAVLLPSFTMYLKKMTKYWESTNTRQDVDFFTLSVVQQSENRKMGKYDPVRYGYIVRLHVCRETLDRTKTNWICIF